MEELQELSGAVDHSCSLCAWCKAQGSPQIVVVRRPKRSWKLHKCPLVSRSCYFQQILRDEVEIEVPGDFPGGLETFEQVVSFCYGLPIRIDLSNVASLRCAAEFLEMTGAENLCAKTEGYLQEHVFTDWHQTLQVLTSCQKVAYSEELISNRCAESLATMARAQIGHVQMKDLIKLPCSAFACIIRVYRRSGMDEKFVSQMVIKYLETWLFSEDETLCSSTLTDEEAIFLLECIVPLLPVDQRNMPVGFLFALLRYSIAMDAAPDCTEELENRIALQLHLASIEDLLMPFRCIRDNTTLAAELESMKRILSVCIAHHDNSAAKFVSVPKLWDEYLCQIAYASSIKPAAFVEMINAISASDRLSHDQLYKAVHIFLKAHSQASEKEKTLICKSIDCRRLSQDICIHAVQSELVPMRSAMKAMLAQQLHSRSCNTRTFNPSLNCFGTTDPGSFEDDNEVLLTAQDSKPDFSDQTSILKSDLEATNSKLQHLEKQLMHIRSALQHPKKKEGVGQRIGKVFQKMGFCKTVGVKDHARECASSSSGSDAPLLLHNNSSR